MALIKCPECGKMMSDEAQACVHCGKPIESILAEIDRQKQLAIELAPKKRAARRKAIIIAIIAAVVIVILGLTINSISMRNRADRISKNFVGRRFYYSAYGIDNRLMLLYSYSFKDDGKVVYHYVNNLNNDKARNEDSTFDYTYEIVIAYDGSVSIKIDGWSYAVTLDDQDIPISFSRSTMYYDEHGGGKTH